MKRKDWSVVIGLVLVTWILDQVSKYWASHYVADLKFYGPLGLVLYHNPGAIMGTFAHLPPLLRVVSLSTGGAFLISIYAAIQFLLRSRSMQLRIGMSLLLGGILGNVTDRIVSGAVTDFILLGTPRFYTPAFNVADAIQWIGYGLVVFGLVRDGGLFWPDSNVRRSVWINPSYQMKYCLTIVAIGACFALINGVFAYTFLKITIDDLVIGSPRMMEQRFLTPFLQTYLIISAGFIVTLFAIARILSHRTAGPIYAFEKWLADMINGKDRRFRIRDGDEFRHLEKLADELRPIIRDAVAEQKRAG